MPSKPHSPATPRARQSAYRARLRGQGLRPVQHWVPDLRRPEIRARIREEAALLPRHPENDVLDDWLEAVIDWTDENWSASIAPC